MAKTDIHKKPAHNSNPAIARVIRERGCSRERARQIVMKELLESSGVKDLQDRASALEKRFTAIEIQLMKLERRIDRMLREKLAQKREALVRRIADIDALSAQCQVEANRSHNSHSN